MCSECRKIMYLNIVLHISIEMSSWKTDLSQTEAGKWDVYLADNLSTQT